MKSKSSDDVLFLLYNLVILGSAVWLIGWHEWNPWWFVPAMMCCASKSSETDESDCDCECDEYCEDCCPDCDDANDDDQGIVDSKGNKL